MAQRRDSLSPPVRPGTETTDPGAHELASDSDEHFSDAHSGPVESPRASPIPRTRVEKVDNSPSYGEVPGTEAYRKREGDAEPDEIAIIPDPDSATKPHPPAGADGSPTTPGGHPIPKTVVEEVPDSPGSVTHAALVERRKSDPSPDVVLRADGTRIEVIVDGDGGQAARAEKDEKAGNAPPGTAS